jgi:hypothetical protein
MLRYFSGFSHRYQPSSRRMRILYTTWKTLTSPLFQSVRPFQQFRDSIRHSTRYHDLNLVGRHIPPIYRGGWRSRYSVKIVGHPSMWGYRDTERKDHDHVDLLWKLLPGKAGNRLKFVERAAGNDISSKCPYIVALKFMTREEKALPVPLGAFSFGMLYSCDSISFLLCFLTDIKCLGRPHCNVGCANLKAHLTKFWPAIQATHTVTIRDGDDVLTKSFDDGLFSPPTNDLCLLVERTIGSPSGLSCLSGCTVPYGCILSGIIERAIRHLGGGPVRVLCALTGGDLPQATRRSQGYPPPPDKEVGSESCIKGGA